MRIHVERVITRIKKFKPLNHIPLTLHRSVYHVWTILWILCNFLPHLIEQLSKLKNWNKQEELEHYLFIYLFTYLFILNMLQKQLKQSLGINISALEILTKSLKNTCESIDF